MNRSLTVAGLRLKLGDRASGMSDMELEKVLDKIYIIAGVIVDDLKTRCRNEECSNILQG